MDFYFEAIRIRPEKERYEDLMNLTSSNIDELEANHTKTQLGK
ncbi:hypothetical protein [Risungbinella massiliensis]|nr:hypothetical protein [Risungbinella massiliensis]